MVKLAALLALLPIAGSAADLSLTIGPPVAAGADAKFIKKVAALFAVRVEQCPDFSKAQVSAIANGMVNGSSTTAQALLQPAGKPGIYVVSENWSGPGSWVVSVTATCGGGTAGAVVPIGPQGFLRESVKTFPRAPTPDDVKAGFQALGQH